METQTTVSNSQILNHRQQTYTLTSLAEQILPKITTEEAKIIDARLSGYSCGQVGKDRLLVSVHKLVFKLCAICGADLPPNETFAAILGEEFVVFITDFGYDNLTESEILLAFRFNAKGTKYPSGTDIEKVNFKGSIFNISSAAKVLANYMDLRNILDRKMQNHIDGY